MKQKTSLLVFVLSLGLFSFSRAETAPVQHPQITVEKRTEIDRMLKLTGMESMIDQMMAQMIGGLRAHIKDVPEEFWARFEKKIHASEMIELVVPLYDKYYSLEDLRALNDFYASPAGQRMLSTLPSIMQESMAIGQQWGAKIGQQAVDEATAEIKEKKEATTKPAK